MKSSLPCVPPCTRHTSRVGNFGTSLIVAIGVEGYARAAACSMLYKVQVAARTVAKAFDDQVLTIKEAASILGVCEMTLRRWDASGRFPARRHPINGYRLYPRKAVEALRRQIERGAA